MTDEDLAFEARDGNRDAFETLISRHYEHVFALSFRLLGNRAEAEDLTHDICLAMAGKLKFWQGRSKFKTWLYRVVVNASHDRRRKHATHSRAAKGWGEVELARRADATEKSERLSWLNSAMNYLKPELRETVALTIDKDMTQAEVAKTLGVPPGTIAWRMSEIKSQLKSIAEREEQL
jgi:RNA polymerase sigma-70 factor (ECF subfamily)